MFCVSDSDDNEGSQNTSFSEIINSDAGSDDDDDDDVARSESGSNSETDEGIWPHLLNYVYKIYAPL